MQKPIISLNKLNFNYKEKTILNINKFEFHRGAMYLFTGTVGSGKTSLLNLLSRKISYDSGTIEYEGQELKECLKKQINTEILFLGQNNKKPWFSGTVGNFMLKFLSKNSLDKDKEKVLKNACYTLKIPAYFLNYNISNLSDGEFRWILIACYLSIDSKVLLIDFLEQMIDYNKLLILNRVLKKKTIHDGVTIIGSSYNPDLFKSSASVIIKLDKGRIIQVRSSSKK